MTRNSDSVQAQCDSLTCVKLALSGSDVSQTGSKRVSIGQPQIVEQTRSKMSDASFVRMASVYMVTRYTTNCFHPKKVNLHPQSKVMVFSYHWYVSKPHKWQEVSYRTIKKNRWKIKAFQSWNITGNIARFWRIIVIFSQKLVKWFADEKNQRFPTEKTFAKQAKWPISGQNLKIALSCPTMAQMTKNWKQP